MIEPAQLIVVRRGEVELYRALREQSASGGSPARVIWDRRMRDRRVIIRDDVDIERRRVERRAAEPPTWTTHGFLITRPRAASGGEDAARGKTQALVESATRAGGPSACGHVAPRGLRTDENHARLYARLLRQSGRQFSGEWFSSRLRSL